ncbi:phage tail terminator family protein [Paenibacillus donghaensis]|uniref:DUF3168 domain-containing protein n=1 Tax=Paenibacillus donghaensis TaxID=414771 RepID=A0A2Z2KS14_9BACL|nr:hypothetical protein [Paenibacillus donghaensis]ASA24322.1 hypothetical protein B9T62_28295 [Paenibacillus donghaensis]
MSVEQLRGQIIRALEQYYPEVPVYDGGEEPGEAYFYPGLISATYDRQREGRYMAIYRFGIRYKKASLLEGEHCADGLSEALAMMQGEAGAYRIVRQAWEAGAAEEGPLFTADFMLYLQSERTEAQKIARMSGGERLK